MVEFRISDFLSPLQLTRTYFLLRRSESWRPEQFAAYQAARLALVLRHAAMQVPYYENLFRERRIDPASIMPASAFATLAALPVLDKDVLRESPDHFIARDAARYRPRAIHTSGTTGTPLTVYWDSGSNVLEFCCIQRLWRWAGIRIGNCFLDLRSRLFHDGDKGLIRADGVEYIRNRKANFIELSSDLIHESNLDAYWRLLLRFRPKLVRGHPNSIQHLAGLLRQRGLTDWRPIAVTTASEALYDYQRRDIEAAWNVPVLDSYGLKEHNVFIAQCPAGTYHVYPEYGVCEILDDDGRPVQPGEEGWIVATGLHNFAQVLLRYQTRDRAVAARGGACPCGRTLPAVERLVGRIDDCIVGADGHRYSGLSFAFFNRRGIKKARLTQHDRSSVTVELVVTPEFDDAERRALMAALSRKVNDAVRFELRQVEQIVQDAPGKFKFVVSHVKL